MPIRLVAMDLDGTLLNAQAEISPVNLQAVASAAGRGVEMVVVTGRRFHSARPIVESLPCPITLITSNGALITTSAGETVNRDFLPQEIAQQVLQVAREYRPYAVGIFHLPERGQLVMQHGALAEGPVSWYLAKCPECLDMVPELETQLNSDLVQIMFGGPPATMEPLESLLRDSCVGKDVHLTWTKYFTRNMSMLDVLNRGCSKGAALKLWAERRGIAASEVMAIGDNYNDIEMLAFSGCPVVMSNCTPGLARPGWPQTLSNDQDGVAAALRAYVL